MLGSVKLRGDSPADCSLDLRPVISARRTPQDTHRERGRSETGGVCFFSFSCYSRQRHATFRTSLPSALGQGSDDSSEGQLWPPNLALHTDTRGRPPVLAHTLPPTPSMTRSLFQWLGWGSLWFRPQARNILVSSRAEVPLHCQKHTQAQLPEIELLVTGDAVNTPGKGP